LLARLQAHLEGAPQPGEEELTRLCHMAGFYEAVYRNGVFSRSRNLLAIADPRTTLDHLTAAVPAYVLEDIAEQLELADQPFAAFQHLPDEQRVCGPVFAGSSDLGGADADFIVGGLLIDCKSTTRTHTIHRSAVRQLAAYLLLDYDDAYGIDQVGLYLSRQGTLITWSVPEFLNALGARVPLPRLRTLQPAEGTQPSDAPAPPSSRAKPSRTRSVLRSIAQTSMAQAQGSMAQDRPVSCATGPCVIAIAL